MVYWFTAELSDNLTQKIKGTTNAYVGSASDTSLMIVAESPKTGANKNGLLAMYIPGERNISTLAMYDASNIATPVIKGSFKSNTEFYAVQTGHSTGLGADLNGYTFTGLYGLENATNCPTGAPYGCLIVIRYGDNANYVTQMWQSVTSDNIWIRHCANGTWSTWVEK